MPGLDGFGIVWELDRQGLLPAQRIIVLTMMGRRRSPAAAACRRAWDCSPIPWIAGPCTPPWITAWRRSRRLAEFP